MKKKNELDIFLILKNTSMKNLVKILLVCACVFGFVDAQVNQRITKARYWLNSATPLNAVEVDPASYSPDSNTVNFSISSIDVSALPAGLHILYVSLQDASGAWGAPKITSFVIGSFAKKKVTKFRYWFNNQTAANAVEISTTPLYNADSSVAVLQNHSIDVSSLSAGLHRLYISAQDASGKWGAPNITSFYVGSTVKNYIVKGQYWFNSPTPVNPTDVNPAYLGDSTRVSFDNVQIDVSSLADGQHTLYFRTQDNTGKWGTAQRTVFTIGGEPKKYIMKGQYWFSNQTVANAVEFTPSYVGDSSRVTANLTAITIPTGLPNGKHTLFVRFQDSKGKWGAPQPIQFVQNAALAPPTIAQMEYFFGNADPGPGNASSPRASTTTGIPGGRSATFFDTFSIDSLALPLGLNKFNVRFKSDKDEWGPTISSTFAVLKRPEFVSTVSDTLRFGKLYSRRDSKVDSFYIKNKGDEDLRVKVKSLPSTQWKVWFADNKDSVVIPKDSFNTDSVKVTVTYSPVQAGKVANEIQFATNDSAVNFIARVPVAATADSAIGKMVVSVDTLRFGKVAINSSKILTLVVGNVGIDTIQVIATGLSNNYFLVEPWSQYRAVGYQSSTDTVQFTIKFTPGFAGKYSGTVYISAYNNQFQYLENKVVYLEGEGVYIQNPTIDVAKSLINFGGVNAQPPKADSSEQTITISNLGQNPLTIDSIVSSNKSIFKVVFPDPVPQTVYNFSPLNVQLRFTPPTGVYQSYNETLTIYNNSTDSNQVVTIPMTGDATNGPPLAVLSLADSVVDFGSVTIGFNLSKSVTIRNKGTGVNKSLNVTSLSINNGLFTTTQTVPFRIAAGDSVTFFVRYAPVAEVVSTGYLTIETDANVRPVRTIELKGRGVVTPQPLLETTMNPLVFSPTKLQTPNAVYFKFRNAGNDTLRADSVFMAKQTSFFTVNKSKLKVAPNQWDSVLVTFTPLAAIDYTDSLIFLSNLNPPRYGIFTRGSGAILAINIDTNVTAQNPVIVGGNQPMQIGIALTASLGSNAVAMLFYKLSGETTFDSVQMTTSDGIRFQGVIPSNKIGTRGAVYYVRVSNGVETIILPQSFVGVSYPTGITKPQDQPAGTKQTNYRMISIPLSGISGSVDSVLKNFGAYDKTKWRLFRYQGSSVGYVEHTSGSFQSFAPGRGYWFITAEPQKIRSGAGQVTPANVPFNIDLQSEWNQIGNPFTFAVSWDSVTGKGSNVGALFDYDGTDYIPVTVMQPWAGYFVKNASSNPVTINIKPVEPTGSLAKSNGLIIPKVEKNEWMLQLKATDGEIADNANFIGVKLNALDEYDENDIEESPRQPGEYLKLTFNNTSWNKRPDKYGYDFRSPSDEGKYWDFEVNTNTTNEKISISMAQFESVPNEFDIVLLDKDAGTAQNLRKNAMVNLPSSKKATTKNFRIVVGTREYIEKNSLGISLVPATYSLSQNYPNPFNPSTTFKYALPTASHVVMKVYDILGKEVATILNETVGEGYHVVQWNATNSANVKTASGVYFCRMTARSTDGLQQYSRTVKMILMK